MSTVAMSEVELVEVEMRLTKDLRLAAKTLSEAEVRFLVDEYYLMQKQRIRSANQVRALGESVEPHSVVAWLQGQSEFLEGQVRAALKIYAESKPLGEWAMSVCGIGPIIAAGLLAHIDATKPTVGHVWRFAGLDPTSHWGKGEKRPWNAKLKTLCWKIGESFVKVQSNENDVYGKVFVERKDLEWHRNLAGDYQGQAAAALKAKDFGDETDAVLWLKGCLSFESVKKIFSSPSREGKAKVLAGEPGSGTAMLPPAHIHSRARRYAVKMFLAHYWSVGHYMATGDVGPSPYAIAHQNHAHEIMPPNLDLVPGYEAAWKTRRAIKVD